jgi:hypothetical protein
VHNKQSSFYEDWSFWACDKYRHDFEGEDLLALFFEPIGFWNYNPFWGRFWVECGFDWD